MFIRFDIIDECDRQTDRHRMTAIAALMHSIAQQKLVEHYPDTLTLTDITLAATAANSDKLTMHISFTTIVFNSVAELGQSPFSRSFVYRSSVVFFCACEYKMVSFISIGHVC